MKHDKTIRILASVLFNALFVAFVWLATQTPIWYIEGHNGDDVVKIFAFVGMCAVLFLINYAIELNTRIKDNKDQNSK